ncbi:MAG TPA: HAD family phosphatase [Acidobacteriota bacterium]|jgi:putative hydrolase of the HAD superfamily|nr:HAD family phosphatase [Acidobacteriota bacterium]
MIRALLFDMGNVLIRFDPHIALERLRAKTLYSPNQMVELLKQWPVILDYECGKIPTGEFFDALCSHLGLCDLNLEQFRDIWSSIFSEEMLVRPSVLRSLKQRYRLMLLSNTNAIHFDFIRQRFPVLQEFDDLLLSYQLRLVKPDPRIFHETVRRSQLAPEEIFYIDDVEDNVAAARAIGILGVRFQNEAQLLEELRKRGLYF